MTHHSRLGISLLELLVTMVSMLLVASMAFHLLLSSNRSASQHLSMTSRGDRLRLLETLLERDLASRFPSPLTAPLQIGNVTGTPFTTDLIAADVLLQGDTDTVSFAHVSYHLRPEQEGGEAWDLVRTAEPLAGTEAVGAGTQSVLFQVEPSEQLLLSATPEIITPTQSRTKLVWQFLDERYQDRPVTREMAVVGRSQP